MRKKILAGKGCCLGLGEEKGFLKATLIRVLVRKKIFAGKGCCLGLGEEKDF